jgi:NADH-quinone oxidoreductase subunit G
MFINPVDYEYTFPIAHKAIVPPAQLVQALAGVAAALLHANKAQPPQHLRELIEQTLPDAAEQAMADTLNEASRATLLLGIGASMHPAYSTLRALAVLVAQLSGARLGFLSDGANSAGACLAGVLPHRTTGGAARAGTGLDAAAMIAHPLNNYLLVGVEPEFDCGDGARALTVLDQAEFVVALTPFVTERMREYADVLLPVNAFSETSGTYVNCEGRWQSFAAASQAPGDSRPGWKVLRVLGNLLELDGFDQTSSEQVRDELREKVADVTWDNSQCGDTVAAVETLDTTGLQRIAWLPPHAVDATVRRAEALQNTPDGDVASICVHPDDAVRFNVADGGRALVTQSGASVQLNVVESEAVAPGSALLSTAIEATLRLGPANGFLHLKQV